MDHELDRALKALPAPRAPRTLAPRVMAAVAAAETRPSATGWFTWRAPWKIASLTAVLAVAAGLGWLFTSPPAPVANVAAETGKYYAAVRVLWDGLVAPLGIFVFVIGIVFALVGAAAWAGLEAALGGASQQQ